MDGPALGLVAETELPGGFDQKGDEVVPLVGEQPVEPAPSTILGANRSTSSTLCSVYGRAKSAIYQHFAGCA